MVCPHGQGGGCELVRTFCEQEGRGIFCDFVRTSFMDRPLSRISNNVVLQATIVIPMLTIRTRTILVFYRTTQSGNGHMNLKKKLNNLLFENTELLF